MLQVVGLVGQTFFVVGGIPGSPSIMFVDIHAERAHVNKRYEKLTDMLTRTGRINVYFTDKQHYITFYKCPKSQTEVNICVHICAQIFQVRIQKYMSLLLGFSFIEHNRFTSVNDLVLNLFGNSNHYNS
jgi:hypothetical protein